MANGEQELVVIGSRFSTQRMIEQGGVSVAVARAHAKELTDKFPPAKVDELEKLLEEIRAAFGTQADAKTAFSTGNVPVNQRIDEAKRWISEVMSAADNAFEEEPEIGDQFHKAGKLGRSVPKITGRLQELTALAQAHKAALAEWGAGEALLAEGPRLLAALAQADAAQELAVKDMPVATRQLNLRKGRAFLLLKKLARAGRTAFRDDPPTRDKLALDILKRTGRRADAGEQTAPAPPSAPPAPTA